MTGWKESVLDIIRQIPFKGLMTEPRNWLIKPTALINGWFGLKLLWRLPKQANRCKSHSNNVNQNKRETFVFNSPLVLWGRCP